MALAVLCALTAGAALVFAPAADGTRENLPSAGELPQRALGPAPLGVDLSQEAATAASHIAAAPNTPEGRLLGIIQLVEGQELDAAMQAAAKLTQDLPHFLAAQLVYADLLRLKAGKGPSLASGASIAEFLREATTAVPEPTQEWQPQLQGLHEELKRRVHGVHLLPSQGSAPAEFQWLGPSVRHAVAIDASKSRLYLFANDSGKLRLLKSFYVSIGKLGMGKSQEGDQRTPQGVYFIGRQIPGAKLPEFYGKGALTLNYPNDWDKAVDRSGTGIWLHGSPPDQFARLPEASDGCIVLANPDLILLMQTLAPRTPVLISEKLTWVAQADRMQGEASDAFLSALASWRQASKHADHDALGRMYDDLMPEKASRGSLAQYRRFANVSMQDISVYAWQDPEGDVRIVNIPVESGAGMQSQQLRQYWRKFGEHWKVFSEEVLG